MSTQSKRQGRKRASEKAKRSTRQDKGVTGVFDSKAYHGVGIL